MSWKYQYFNTDISGWKAQLENFVLKCRPRADGVHGCVCRADASSTAWFHLWLREDHENADYEVEALQPVNFGTQVEQWLEKGDIVPITANSENPPKVWAIRTLLYLC
jgi:hypothetical protein